MEALTRRNPHASCNAHANPQASRLPRCIKCHADPGWLLSTTVDPSVLAEVCAGVALTSATLRIARDQQRFSAPVITSRGEKSWSKPAPENPCNVCGGSGKLTCPTCSGRGRVNHVHQAVLPKNEFPLHCLTCRGTTRAACYRCLGKGERPPSIGFRT